MERRRPAPIVPVAACPLCGRGARELVALTLSAGGAVVACRPCVERTAEAVVELRSFDRTLLAW